MKSKEQLEAALKPLQVALNKMRDAEVKAESLKFVGRCFKYRNCYSMPKKPSDYWWLYSKVLRVGTYRPIAFQFQVDKDGRIEIEQTKSHAHMSGYQEISAKEFDAAWRRVQKRIAGMKP